MVENADGENHEPADYEKIRTDQEAKLNAQPTLDTDILEFLAILGWRYTDDWRELLSHPATVEISEQLFTRHLERRAALPRKTRTLEVRLLSVLFNAYQNSRIKTLGDLKCRVEDYSLTTIPGLGVKGVVHLNSILKNYGLAPMGVAQSTYSPETLFKRYGLHSTKT